MSARGKFITLEGVDGAGKSTHLQFIADALRAGGRHVVVTREPGGTDARRAAAQSRSSRRSDAACRRDAARLRRARATTCAKVIRPALGAGSWVVCDRFTDATIAYQGAGQGVRAAS